MQPVKVKDIQGPIIDYLTSDSYTMQEKIDGERLVIELGGGQLVGMGRKGQSVEVPAWITHQFNDMPPGIYDGELIRSQNEYHIFSYEYEGAEFKPVDLPHKEGHGIFWVETWSSEGDKISALQHILHVKHGEGVVFTHTKTGNKYRFKPHRSIDCFISKKHDRYELAVYKEGKIVDIGSFEDSFGNPTYEVGDVVEVKYSHLTRNNRLFKADVVRKRTDKEIEDCLYEQLKERL